MRVKPDNRCPEVEAGSALQRRLCRPPTGDLRLAIEADRQWRREAWAESRHVKTVERLAREADEAQREWDRPHRFFRVKADVGWHDRHGPTGSAVRGRHRVMATRGAGSALPNYGRALRDRAGRLFVFQRIRYYSARTTEQGRCAEAARYAMNGAHVLAGGEVCIASNVGEHYEEIVAGFDKVELVNRTTAANAKTAFHGFMQSCHNLTPEQQFEAAKEYAEYTFGRHQLPYLVVLHAPSDDGDERNWHVHILYSLRPMLRTGEGEWTVGAYLRTDLDNPEQFKRLRYLWAEELNAACERAGVAKRYTHLSYAAAGVDYIPQTRLGRGLTEMVRRGEHVAINVENHRIAVRNAMKRAVNEARSALRAGVAKARGVVDQLRETIEVTEALARSMSNGSPEMLRGVAVPRTPFSASNVAFSANDLSATDSRPRRVEVRSTQPPAATAAYSPDVKPMVLAGIGSSAPVQAPLHLESPARKPTLSLATSSSPAGTTPACMDHAKLPRIGPDRHTPPRAGSPVLALPIWMSPISAAAPPCAVPTWASPPFQAPSLTANASSRPPSVFAAIPVNPTGRSPILAAVSRQVPSATNVDVSAFSQAVSSAPATLFEPVRFRLHTGEGARGGTPASTPPMRLSMAPPARIISQVSVLPASQCEPPVLPKLVLGEEGRPPTAFGPRPQADVVSPYERSVVRGDRHTGHDNHIRPNDSLPVLQSGEPIERRTGPVSSCIIVTEHQAGSTSATAGEAERPLRPSSEARQTPARADPAASTGTPQTEVNNGGHHSPPEPTAKDQALAYARKASQSRDRLIPVRDGIVLPKPRIEFKEDLKRDALLDPEVQPSLKRAFDQQTAYFENLFTLLRRRVDEATLRKGKEAVLAQLPDSERQRASKWLHTRQWNDLMDRVRRELDRGREKAKRASRGYGTQMGAIGEDDSGR